MTQIPETDSQYSPWSDVPFTAHSVVESEHRTVYLAGELDLHTNPRAAEALGDGADGRTVIVDMSDLSFMDCAGYRAIVAARRHANQRGATLTLAHAHGEPSTLLALLDELGLA